MDKIAEFIRDNLGSFLTTCFGLLVPGALTIALFKLDFYLKLDILKLLYLSIVISAPTYVALIGVATAILSTMKGTKKHGLLALAVYEASILNILIFSVPLFLKMLFPSMTKLRFVEIIMLLLLVTFLTRF